MRGETMKRAILFLLILAVPTLARAGDLFPRGVTDPLNVASFFSGPAKGFTLTAAKASWGAGDIAFDLDISVDGMDTSGGRALLLHDADHEILEIFSHGVAPSIGYEFRFKPNGTTLTSFGQISSVSGGSFFNLHDNSGNLAFTFEYFNTFSQIGHFVGGANSGMVFLNDQTTDAGTPVISAFHVRSDTLTRAGSGPSLMSWTLAGDEVAKVMPTGGIFTIAPDAADDTSEDSPSRVLRAKYDSIPGGGVAVTSRDVVTFHNITQITPIQSQWELKIAGVLELIAHSEGGITIGDTGTRLDSSPRASATIDIASVAAQTCLDTAITVTGAALAAECSVGLPAAPIANLSFTCFVSAANTAQIRSCNPTGSAIDPASADYSVRTFNP